jgi:hypothetical protein
MKKLLLLAAVIGTVFFTSCDKTPFYGQPGVEKATQRVGEPTIVGVWRTTHQYFKLEVDGHPKLKQQLEREIDEDIPEAGLSYQLTFREGGRGSGSKLRYGNNGRGDFTFDWELKDDKMISLAETGENYIGVFNWYDMGVTERIGWEIEELSSDKLVLSTIMHVMADGELDGIPIPWYETHTYRYTFTKQKPGEESIKPLIDPTEHTFIGSWRTTDISYSRKLDETAPEELQEASFMETSIASGLGLTFNQTGKGSGSVRVDGTASSFDFRWYPSRSSIDLYGSYDGGALFRLLKPQSGVGFSTDWYIEELAAGKMVLAVRAGRWVPNPEGPGGWDEAHTYRFAFDRVE